MDPLCTFYADDNGIREASGTTDPGLASCMVLTPIIDPVNGLPFYHPSVSHIAFRYIPSMLASYDWRLRHAGLMAIAAMGEGTSKVSIMSSDSCLLFSKDVLGRPYFSSC